MKVRMSVFGGDYVVSVDVANQISELLEHNAEVYEHKWNRGDDNKHFYTNHVYELSPTEFVPRLDLITDSQYAMYKLAGKPKN